jgi:diaminopimelate epimerase
MKLLGGAFMHMTKMQGLGNDYLYFYGELPDPAAQAVRLSDRHFGVGGDGLILIGPSETADFQMRVFNADGSEAGMCGNGIRCLGKYVYDKGYTEKTRLSVETRSGIRTLELAVVQGKVAQVTVSMGRAQVGETLTLCIEGRTVVCTPVSMGNPHAVLFVPDAQRAPLTILGPALQHHEAFPDGVNVEFAQVVDRRTIRMRVWERGSGVTLACGTGACACAAAAIRAGLCQQGAELTVRLDGGDLRVAVSKDGCVQMTGPAETVCECEVEDDLPGHGETSGEDRPKEWVSSSATAARFSGS